MRMKLIIVMGSMLAASGCIPRADQPRDEPARPAPPPVQAPLPAPPPAAADWRDIPLTPGNWSYGAEAGGSAAMFGAPETEALFAVRCNRAARRITLSLEGANQGPMTIRTSTSSRALPITVEQEPIAYSHASLAATDPLLDAMVFSRGRFTVETPGQRMIVIPAWPEPARVVEDCRG